MDFFCFYTTTPQKHIMETNGMTPNGTQSYEIKIYTYSMRCLIALRDYVTSCTMETMQTTIWWMCLIPVVVILILIWACILLMFDFVEFTSVYIVRYALHFMVIVLLFQDYIPHHLRVIRNIAILWGIAIGFNVTINLVMGCILGDIKLIIHESSTEEINTPIHDQV